MTSDVPVVGLGVGPGVGVTVGAGVGVGVGLVDWPARAFINMVTSGGAEAGDLVVTGSGGILAGGLGTFGVAAAGDIVEIICADKVGRGSG